MYETTPQRYVSLLKRKTFALVLAGSSGLPGLIGIVPGRRMPDS
ncbi:MAG: hypothetical protein WBN81_03390 [Gammaproteobacteria bacterium]